MERNNLRHQYKVEAKGLESSCAEKALGVLKNTKLNMSQKCALAARKADSLLESTGESVSSR